jgi:AraC-like DNA-binding protein
MAEYKSSIFTRTVSAPKWEGVIFPGIEKDDHRVRVFAASVPETLEKFIEAIWYMEWDLPEEPLMGIGVPIPCVKLSATSGFGPGQGLASVFLSPKDKGILLKFGGQGQGFGIDFKPGGLFPFLSKDFIGWKDLWVPTEQIFPQMPSLPSPPWSLRLADQWFKGISEFMIDRLPMLQENHLDLISKAVDLLWLQDILTMEEIADECKVSPRTLQRVFQNEVGLSIKETMRIVRFNKALRAIYGRPTESLVNLALDSGYFDQAHMSGEFKKLVSESPKVFRKFW